jgi:hypothetical protein
MSRLIRISFLALAIGVCATGAFANIPVPELSDVPDAIVLSPGVRYGGNPIGGFTVTVAGTLGPVNGSFVEVEVSPDADVIVSWCAAPHGGGGGQAHPLLSGFTNASGVVSFQFFGGACLNPDDFFGATYIAQVRADGIPLDEPFITSPDAVNASGKKATTDSTHPGVKRCDTQGLNQVAQVSLSDAVYHTAPIKRALAVDQGGRCTKFTPPFNSPVGVADAVFLTPYIKNANFCICQ